MGGRPVWEPAGLAVDGGEDGVEGVDDWGIQQEWVDAQDRVHRVRQETARRLRDVIGAAPEDLDQRAPLVTRPGRDRGPGRQLVTCEDGTRLEVEGRLPEDFPLGYHRLRTAAGAERRLIV